MSEVAFIGLGTMGQGMARNLSRAGHEVTAWNRTRRPLPAELDRIAEAESVAGAIRGKPVIMVCVTGPEAQRAVFDEALLDHLGPDVLVIDFDYDGSGRLGAACASGGGAGKPISRCACIRQQVRSVGGAARLRLWRR